MWPYVLTAMLTIVTTTIVNPAYAGPGREAWHKSDLPGRGLLIQAYQQFFKAYQAEEKLGAFKGKKAAAFFQIFADAWAVDPTTLDCFYAGWPSKRVGTCSSPARSNPDYNQGNCKATEMRCQPLLFGDGLCVSVATRDQRQVAFSSCERKYRQANRTSLDVVKEVHAGNKEAQLLALMDKADQVCQRGAQAGTGMCRRLEAIVAGIRTSLGSPEGRAAVASTTILGVISGNAEDAEPAGDAAAISSCIPEVPLTIVSTAELIPSTGVQLNLDLQPVVVDLSETTVDAETSPNPEPSTTEQVATAEAVVEVAAAVEAPRDLKTPSEFLAAANAPLNFVGKGSIQGVANSCMLQNAQVAVLYMPCVSDNGGQVHMKIIARAGGTMDLAIENKASGSLKDLSRNQFTNVWLMGYAPSAAFTGSSIAAANQVLSAIDLKNFCHAGPTVTEPQFRCSGTVPNGADWMTAAQSYWQNPDAELYNLLNKTNQNVAKAN